MSLFLIYICVGIIDGSLFSIMFFRMDSSFKKAVSLVGGAGGFCGTYVGLNELLNIQVQSRIDLFAVLIISFVVSSAISLYFMCRMLNKQSGYNVIRAMDIFVGYSKCFENYYINRQKEIDASLNYDKLQNYKEELERREKEIKERETNIEEKEKLIHNAAINLTHIKLPLNNAIAIDSEFIEELPIYIESLVIFNYELSSLTNDFISKYDEHKNNDYTFLIGYFLAVCSAISKYLFESNSKSVRVHVRIRVGDSYEKLVAWLGLDEFKESLTPIPSDKGMIYESHVARRSLIKSLNVKDHLQSKNDSVWQDYMTFALSSICENDSPFLSMGISVRNKAKYRKLMYFLNFYKIENTIQENVLKLHAQCDIIKGLKI